MTATGLSALNSLRSNNTEAFMNMLRALLSGKKTYLLAAAILVYQVIGHYVYGHPWNVEEILTALGLSTLRAGVTKSGRI